MEYSKAYDIGKGSGTQSSKERGDWTDTKDLINSA